MRSRIKLKEGDALIKVKKSDEGRFVVVDRKHEEKVENENVGFVAKMGFFHPEYGVGSAVVFQPYAGRWIELGSGKYLLMSRESIIAVVYDAVY